MENITEQEESEVIWGPIIPMTPSKIVLCVGNNSQILLKRVDEYPPESLSIGTARRIVDSLRQKNEQK